MAKKAIINRNLKRQKEVLKYADRRRQLLDIIRKVSSGDDEKYEARIKLQKLPKNASPVRVRNRCALTGRPRGVYAKFGLGRGKLRDIAMSGKIPGIIKASW